MPTTEPLDLSIDPLTGNVPLAVGTAVFIEDEFGKKHRGYITDIDHSTFTVLVDCKGQDREVTVNEAQILARVSGGYEG